MYLHIKKLASLLVFAVAMVSATSANAARKVALVIGNSAYQHVAPLPNPKNDAIAISASLKLVGFEVTTVQDLTYQEMRLALRSFSDDALGSDIAMVYYAGHGIEVDKNNYLIPIDAKLKKDTDVEFEALSLEQFNLSVSGAKGLKMILLDACRDNPFAQSMKRTIATRSIGRGLAKVEPVNGSLVSFAAKEGTVASDGSGTNSPYAAALLQHIAEPGLDIQLMFRKVRDSVMTRTAGRQEPFTYASLPGKNIYLIPPVEEPVATAAPSGAVVPFPANNGQSKQADNNYWNSIVNLNSKEMFESYIAQFPNGQYVPIAQFRIKQLEGGSAEVASKLDGSKSAETGTQRGTEVASLQPEDAPAERTLQSGPIEDLALKVQNQLNRVGCSVGRADGSWGPASRRGARNYARHSGYALDTSVPTEHLYRQLVSTNSRVCPVTKKVVRTRHKTKRTSRKRRSGITDREIGAFIGGAIIGGAIARRNR